MLCALGTLRILCISRLTCPWFSEAAGILDELKLVWASVATSVVNLVEARINWDMPLGIILAKVERSAHCGWEPFPG